VAPELRCGGDEFERGATEATFERRLTRVGRFRSELSVSQLSRWVGGRRLSCGREMASELASERATRTVCGLVSWPACFPVHSRRSATSDARGQTAAGTEPGAQCLVSSF